MGAPGTGRLETDLERGSEDEVGRLARDLGCGEQLGRRERGRAEGVDG